MEKPQSCGGAIDASVEAAIVAVPHERHCVERNSALARAISSRFSNSKPSATMLSTTATEPAPPGLHRGRAVLNGALVRGSAVRGARCDHRLFRAGQAAASAAHHMTNCWVREEDGRVLVKMKWFVPDPAGNGFFGGDNDDGWFRTDAGWRSGNASPTVRTRGCSRQWTRPRERPAI